jgi:tetratricopeptide (TPR) repeat protein
VTGELAARSLLLAIQQSIGSYDEARRHGEAALALSTRTGRVRDMAVAQNNLIWHDLRIADLAAAQRRLAAVDRLSARAGEHKLRALARANLAEVLRLDGRYDESVQVGLRAVEMLAEVGDPGHRRRLLGVVGLSYALGGRLEEGEKVLAEIRAQLPDEVSADRRPDGLPATAEAGEGSLAEDWDCSMIEATLARQRGQRMLAASWYAAAAGDGGSDPRDLAEALVGLIGTADDPQAAQAQLADLCESAGIALTVRERAQVEARA